VRLEVVTPESSQAVVPLVGNVIVLGNRSTNATCGALYDRYYTLVDLKYPGPNGYALRTVHNPFGNGFGAVIVGGSDDAGVAAGAAALADLVLRKSASAGELSVGWIMETRLGDGVRLPTDLKNFETWEASKNYGSIGYFGWCSISKRMAMYYMTGEPHHAREFVRLAFPDRKALAEIEEFDGERIENKHDPLAGFYHYNAHLAILFWDLIEESPVFSNEERLKITNAFARQLNHRKGEGVYGLTRAPASVGSRHGQWSAVSLYCLGRYFQKDYPHPVWAQCLKGSQWAFRSLDRHAWVAGESDNLFWYSTGLAPALTYLVLSGERKPLANGVLAELLRGQEILASGRSGDWALSSAALDFLNKAAYLTGDGRWLAYRWRTGVDCDVFRLGQSFWPDASLQAKPPTDLVNQWSIQRLSRPAWAARRSGLSFDESFYFGSYRSTTDDQGDFVLLDGFNGASRNPYHTFDLLQLRIAGRTLLDGYHNQVLTSADGMVEPEVAMDAALLHRDVVGHTVAAVGEVRKAAFCNWRRALAQRVGRYALVVDDLTFRDDSRNMKVVTNWQAPGSVWDRKHQVLRWPGRAGSSAWQLCSADAGDATLGEAVTMAWNGAVRKGDRRLAFHLLGADVSSSSPPGCARIAENAAALALPQPAVAVAGRFEQTAAQLAIVAHDHLFGWQLTAAGIEGQLVTATVAVDIDWNFADGVLHVVAPSDAELTMRLQSKPGEHRGPAVTVVRSDANGYVVRLAAGRHVFSDVLPRSEELSSLRNSLARCLERGRQQRQAAMAAGVVSKPNLSALPSAFVARVGGKATDLVALPLPGDTAWVVAEGTHVHLLSSKGERKATWQADGAVRVVRWWPEPQLLLVGCADEKVIAFDRSGQRKWVFVSQMDPAVYEAAKTYWFKSAPGHEGIHGLFTGEFGGSERCFVGSACTLEILSASGELIKRTPVFWGPGWKFGLFDAPGGARNLLVARWPNGSDDLAVVGSRTMTVESSGFQSVPPGHAYVGGWTAQNRTGLFCRDLDGDGRAEVATAINGTWNRVTVYSAEGRPLANAQFGPGVSKTPRSTMRDMDLADLNGDSRTELIVALAEGLVVALDCRCQRLWSTRLSNPPLSLRCVSAQRGRAGRVVVGCDDGSVLLMNEQGELLAGGAVDGRPWLASCVANEAASQVTFATDRGEVKAFVVGD